MMQSVQEGPWGAGGWPVQAGVPLPEVVAGVQGLIGCLVIKATETVFWVAVMGPTVQVAVPVDLNAHYSSLGKTTRGKL